MTATLIIKSIFFQTENPFLEKIIVDNQEYKYSKEIEMQIIFNDIEFEIGVKVVHIKLIFRGKNKPKEHFFEIMKGSKICGYLLPIKGKTLDIILNEKSNYKSKIVDHDSFSNLDVKDNRLLIINFDNMYYDLFINEENISEKLDDISGKSIQISIPNLKEKYYFYKNIVSIDYEVFFNLYEKYKDLANSFILGIKEFIKNDKINDFRKYLLSFDNLFDGYNIKLNLPKKILADKYNRKEYFNFISSCSLFYLLSNLNNDKIEEIRKFYQVFIDYQNKLEKSKLENYLKSLIIIDFSQRLVKFESVEDFKKIDYQYLIKSDLEPNSPLNLALLELEKMIEILEENSPFYYPLVLIDSGSYILESKYGKKLIYGYGLTSINILKDHLKNIMPEIIIVFKDQTIFKDDQGLTDKYSGIISLNLSCQLLSDLVYMNINNSISDEKTLYDLSLRIFIILFHEVLGHKKGGYIFNNADVSPNFFYDQKNKEIMKLDYLYSSNIAKNCIKILRDSTCKSDSGSFLELFLGDTNYGYISLLIEIMLLNKINLNSIFNIKLWDKNINILQDYIKLKYIVFINNKELLDKSDYKNIEEEIKYLRQVIKEYNFEDFNKTSNENISKNKYEIIRKRKELFSSEKYTNNDFSEYDDLSMQDIRNRFKDKNLSFEEKRFYIRLLDSRTQRK